MTPGRFFAALAFFLLLSAPFCHAKAITLVDWRDLEDKNSGKDGRAALAINREAWKHAETAHFVYHFRDTKKAEMVYHAAEAYYQWIKEMFGVSEDAWEGKCHIYMFEDAALWREFNRGKTGEERQPGFSAYTDGSELFIHISPFFLAPKMTLAHEISHVVLHRFVEGRVPLFLNEGFAEFMSSRAMALRTGGNEYAFRTLKLIPEHRFIPLRELVAMRTYPANKDVFYQESEFVARYFLLNFDKKLFYTMLRRTATGESFESALKSIYGIDLDTFEQKFKTYAMVTAQE